MISELQAWAIFFLPLASFTLIALVIRPFLGSRSVLSSYLTIATIGVAFALSLYALNSTINHEGAIGWESHPWLTISDLEIRIGILMDPLTSIMLVVVTGVSLLVQIYSQGYMKEDPSYSRYFAYMSLFTASMVGIVLARSIIQLYVFWELVGLSSYLLIGFWHTRPAAAAAAKKAFLVTRIGDVGLLLAILYLFLQRNTPAFEGLNPFEIPDILTAAVSMTAFAVTWTSIGIFAGAAGKSGQFPLHTWLPDAMEGPTPVSSLIHAATMVAAGVFLVVRFFDLFAESSVALMTVALVGGFTAVFAATMGLVMFDIKRVLAYSTVSQLGYMMLAIGIGAPAVAMFHLFTHAFFKCLLFLGAGSVNHATGTFDMRYMGGLRSAMPWTYWTFVVAALSLAGIFPLAGFWSKDEILLSAWRGVDGVDTVVFSLAFIGVFLTAFYMYRVVSMTFHGEFKGGIEKELEGQNEQINGSEVHVGESPVVMVVPLVILAGASLVAGYLVNPISSIGGIPAHWFTEFLGGHSQGISLGVAFFSTATALAGIVASYMWGRMPLSNLSSIINPLRTLMLNKYYLDVLCEHIVVKKLFYQRIARITDWFDANVIDRFVDFLGWIGRNIGKAIAPIQNGQVQVYGIIILLGVAVIIGTYLIVEN